MGWWGMVGPEAKDVVADERHAEGLVGLANERRESCCGPNGSGCRWWDTTAAAAAGGGRNGGATLYCPVACRSWYWWRRCDTLSGLADKRRCGPDGGGCRWRCATSAASRMSWQISATHGGGGGGGGWPTSAVRAAADLASLAMGGGTRRRRWRQLGEARRRRHLVLPRRVPRLVLVEPLQHAPSVLADKITGVTADPTTAAAGGTKQCRRWRQLFSCGV